MAKIRSSEITPEHIYLSRRRFMQGLGIAAACAALAACVPSGTQTGNSDGIGAGRPTGSAQAAPTAGSAPAAAPAEPGRTMTVEDTGPGTTKGTADELGASLTTFKSVTNYNNYYEFSTAKEGVAPQSKGFKVAPWTVQVGGLVQNPKTYAVDDLVRKFPPEEHIYRLRCVEAWSMVIPWLGFQLNKLLAEVAPTSAAKFVRFQTINDPKEMPGQTDGYYAWPYTEGLRLDEAMNDLVLLATGLYGKPLLPQNGAPLRVVVPWKYGFKSIKAIVKIDLVAEQPTSLWMAAAPDEYGFYSNVNPDVPHPRWSQSSERRIGELERRRTLPFNGYAEQVAALYTGMDLKKNY